MRFAALLLAVLLAFPALPLDFGAPFPLTNTRYGSAFAVPELVWTGRDLFLFWAAPNHVRMTRVTVELRAERVGREHRHSGAAKRHLHDPQLRRRLDRLTLCARRRAALGHARRAGDRSER